MENNAADEDGGDNFDVNSQAGRPQIECCLDGCTKVYQNKKHLSRHQRE
jgi:hypothetical protein